jgi:phage terminase large subunit-like protein
MLLRQGNSSLLESLALLTAPQRAAVIASLSDPEAEAIMWDWRGCAARPNQLAPGTLYAEDPRKDWRYWLVDAGRGFGKTRTGAEWTRESAETGKYRRMALVGATAADVRDVMVEGDSGILNCCPPNNRPLYEPSKRRLTWPNGALATMYSADEPERLRGPQHDGAWCDEIAAWRFPDAWDNLLFGLRIGDDPRAVVTTTPKPVKIVKDLINDPNTVVTRGSSYENRSNLAPAFFDSIIRKYEGTRIGRQELLAELLEDVPGALWTRQVIDDNRGKPIDVRMDGIIRICVAIDPAVTSNPDSDETGIVVAALTRGWHVLILDDLSCRVSARAWADIAVHAYRSRRADVIVAEVNNGGDLVAANIRAVNPNVNVRSVRASRGKAIRAEPVANLYEQGRVHHIGTFPELEDQLCGWTPQGNEKSPDRLDALVWAVTELLIDEDKSPQGLAPAGEFQISSI